MSNACTTWIGVLQGLLTPLIAMIAVYFAYQQHRTARDKLRLDLYSKRFAVYHGLRDLIAIVVRDASVELSDINSFSATTLEATFLFEDEISEYLRAVRSCAIDLRSLRDKLDGPGSFPVGRERSAAAEAEGQLLRWFTEQGEAARNLFSKYLRFGE